MNITVQRRFHGAPQMAARLEQIAIPAAELVAARLGGRAPHTEFVITDANGVAQGMRRADSEPAGPPRGYKRITSGFMAHWTARHSLGATTLARRGVVVFINGPSHRGDLDLFDQTVVHELAHSVQLGTSEARRRHIEYLATFTARTPDVAVQRDYERLMDIREQQAENLEALTRWLD
ncbi:hypothetical protein [Streptomyces sp. 5-6(2022)]|uniref:hypothetical protein n=1 Tax=Streptomyces sp. 5-6(2022) TaxID=2936510 RepID=UPI0023B8A5EC|nr:hypothetical protein [Streptomyces sp. 5-6(2022)]